MSSSVRSINESRRMVRRIAKPRRCSPRRAAVPRSSRPERVLERLLAQHEAELLAQKRSLRDDLQIGGTDVRDEMEHSVEHLARAVGVALLEVSSSAIRGIETALRRVKNGQYGRCLDCGGKIAVARLKVLPFAERCRNCQQQLDAQLREGEGAARFASPLVN
jgi:DnaK suppressor protein